jgi:hypothetical protein
MLPLAIKLILATTLAAILVESNEPSIFSGRR